MNNKTGLPIDLVTFLRDRLDIKTFVETGTGLGRTAKIASELFQYVITIEANLDRYHYNANQFANTNVNCVLGESPNALKAVVNSLNDIAIIFLDAHCSYREQVTTVACPVIEEIKVIPNQHIVIIDDAHSFLYPHKVEAVRHDWPELTEVLFELYERNTPYIFVIGKAIVSIPRGLKTEVQTFLTQK